MADFNFGEVIVQALANQKARQLQKEALDAENLYREQNLNNQKLQMEQQQNQFVQTNERLNKAEENDRMFKQANLVDRYMMVDNLETLPEYARKFAEGVTTVEGRFNMPDAFKPEFDNRFLIDKALYNQAMQEDSAQKRHRESIAASRDLARRNDLKEFYKYGPDGSLLGTILATPDEMKNTYLNPNDKNWNINKNYVFSTQPQMGNLMLNREKLKDSRGKVVDVANLIESQTNALSNSKIQKLDTIGNLPDEELWNNFRPDLRSKNFNPFSEAGISQSDANKRWTNQKESNTSYLTGLLNESINPMLEVIETINANKKTSNDYKQAQETEILLAQYAPVLERLRTGFDQGYFNQAMKNQYYDALKKVRGLYNKNAAEIQRRNLELIRKQQLVAGNQEG